uniref:Uncharacterized protein n=1 Tax=Strigamia maritima TaxID=126957 RepID=T1IIH6_STRMM
MTFRGSVNLEQMKTTVKTKWTNVKKKNDQYKHLHLRQQIVDSCGYFYWLLEKNFSIDDHVQIYDCKPPKNQNELDDLCTEICSQPLSENKSPWITLIFPLDDSFGDEPRYVVFFRLHHCMGDGVNLTQMLNRCVLDEKHLNILTPNLEKKFSIKTLLTTFFYFPKYALDTIPNKELNILHGPPQTGKRFFRHLTSYSLPRVKKIGKATGATINDLMVSCIAGALKKYFAEYDAPPVRDVHSIIPIATQSSSEEVGFKNNISVSHIILALSDKTALARLKSTQRIMRKYNKKSPFYIFSYYVVKLFVNRLPYQITRLMFYLQDSTCIISNIPMQQSQCLATNGDELLHCYVFPVHFDIMGKKFPPR